MHNYTLKYKAPLCLFKNGLIIPTNDLPTTNIKDKNFQIIVFHFFFPISQIENFCYFLLKNNETFTSLLEESLQLLPSSLVLLLLLFS